MRITKLDLVRYGYSEHCPRCRALEAKLRKAEAKPAYKRKMQADKRATVKEMDILNKAVKDRKTRERRRKVRIGSRFPS